MFYHQFPEANPQPMDPPQTAPEAYAATTAPVPAVPIIKAAEAITVRVQANAVPEPLAPASTFCISTKFNVFINK